MRTAFSTLIKSGVAIVMIVTAGILGVRGISNAFKIFNSTTDYDQPKTNINTAILKDSIDALKIIDIHIEDNILEILNIPHSEVSLFQLFQLDHGEAYYARGLSNWSSLLESIGGLEYSYKYNILHLKVEECAGRLCYQVLVRT